MLAYMSVPHISDCGTSLGHIPIPFASRIAETESPAAIANTNEPGVFLETSSSGRLHLPAARPRELHAMGLGVHLPKFRGAESAAPMMVR